MHNILILTTTFFPDPKVGSVRMTQWSRYLPEFGWTPTVLCRRYDVEATPEQLAKHVHPSTQVVYLNSPPHPTRTISRNRKLGAAGRALGLNAWSVPDLSIAYWRSVRQRVLDELRRRQPSLILTSSPAHGVHDLGRWLAQEAAIPWVADFRDPYVIDPRFQPKGIGWLAWPRHLRFEATIYEQASLVIHAIPVHGRWARLQYPAYRSKIRILPNGFPDELLSAMNDPVAAERNRRSVRIIGVPGDNAAITLADAVSLAVQRGHDLDLRFVGRPPTTFDRVQAILGDRVMSTGQLPHHDALRQMAGADILVSLLDVDRARSKGLSSKLFEFLGTGKPIIAINPTGPDRQLLRAMHGVVMLSTPDTEMIATAIEKQLSADALPPDSQTERVRRTFSRREQVRLLAKDLDRLVE